MTQTFRIAVIPGDGIGKEVMPEGLRVLQAAAKRFDISLALTPIEWASCDYFAGHGKMMPDDWKAQLQGFDAILFGAVGWPAKVPDHVSLWGSLLKFRREFDQYINLRPVRLFEGVPCPLVDKTGKPRRNFSSEPHSDTWSGTVAGQPTAPNRIASKPCSCAFQSSGIIFPWPAK